MSQPTTIEEPEEKPKRCFRYYQEARKESRSRGSRRGSASRWALKSLPPIEEDEP